MENIHQLMKNNKAFHNKFKWLAHILNYPLFFIII